MAKIETKTDLKLTVEMTLKLTEAEAQALDAIIGYGDDEFLKIFYQHMGKAYLQPYEKGFRSLSRAIREQLEPQLYELKRVRDALVKAKLECT